MDLTFTTEKGKFNYRVGAIIIQNNKVLMVKNKTAPYYYSVGGRVKYNESCEEAIKREVKEELGIPLEVERAVFFHENFFIEKVSKERFHEIAMFFLMKTPPDLENMICDSFTEAGEKETLHWVDIDRLGEVMAFPSFFATELKHIPAFIKTIVTIQD